MRTCKKGVEAKHYHRQALTSEIQLCEICHTQHLNPMLATLISKYRNHPSPYFVLILVGTFP